MVSKEQILKSLSAIIDPDFQRDIVSLGFVQDIRINNSDVSFTIELTTPACPLSPEFKRQAMELVSSLEGVDKVSVNMTARSTNEKIFNVENSGLKKVKYILAISSCKGGVGKSTISALVAKNLASRGIKVGLLDADIYGPSIPTIFNIHQVGIKATKDNHFYPKEVEGLKLMSFGFLMGDKPAVIRGPMVAQYMQQLLHNVIWDELDYLIIDMPPGTGDIQLTICQSIQIDASLIITTPHQLSLTDVKKGIMMFDKVNVPILGVVENMSYYECCEEKHFIFGKGGSKTLSERFGIDTIAELPISPDLGFNYDKLSNSKIAQDTVNLIIRALGKKILDKPIQPNISFDMNKITLKWSDNESISISNRLLRESCDCALCVDEMTRKPILNIDTIPNDIHAKEISTIGNYAILVNWSDGHNTGFFPFNTIRQLVQKSGGHHDFMGCEI